MSQPPEPTELIYQSAPSIRPALVAAGLAAVIVGLFTWWPYAAAGGIITLVALIGWLRENRREIGSMPTNQHTETGPIPLGSAKPQDS